MSLPEAHRDYLVSHVHEYEYTYRLLLLQAPHDEERPQLDWGMLISNPYILQLFVTLQEEH